MRLNFFSFFMRLKFLIIIRSPDHPFFMRSKFKKSIIRQFQSHDRFVSYKYDHEVKIQKSIIIAGSNPGTIYWMAVSDASYYIKEKLKIKVAKWGTPRNI
jgi:hypothetical protein